MTKTLGDRIRELREEKDLSLRELAKKIKVTPPFLSDVELGKRFPSDENLALIAAELDTSVEALKQFDTRPPVEEMKRKAAQNPDLGVLFRKMVDLPPEEIRKLLDGRSEGDDKK